MNDHNLKNNNDVLDDDRISLDIRTINTIQKLYSDFINDPSTKSDDLINAIYNSLQIVIKNQSYLYNKLSDSKSQNTELNAKLEQALKLASIDHKTINNLVEEVQRAWEETEKLRKKEKKAVETANLFKLEIFNLSKLVEQDVGLTMGQEFNLREISRQKEDLIEENKTLKNEINQFDKTIENFVSNELILKKEIESKNIEITKTYQELQGSRLEVKQISRRNEQLNMEISNLKNLNESLETSVNSARKEIDILLSNIENHEKTIKNLRTSIDVHKKEMEYQIGRYHKLQNEIDQLYLRIDSMITENNQLAHHLKQKQDQIDSFKLESNQIQKLRDIYERKIKIIENQIVDLQGENELLKTNLDSANKEINQLDKDLNNLKKQINYSLFEKDKCLLQLKKVKLASKNQINNTISLKLELKTIKKENNELKNQLEILKNTIDELNKDKTRYIDESNGNLFKINRLNEVLKLKESSIAEICKKNEQLERKINANKKFNEKIVKERDLLAKNLHDKSIEMVRLKAEIKNSKQLENKMNRSLNVTEQKADKLKNEKTKLESHTKILEHKLDINQTKISELKSTYDCFETSERSLLKIIKNLEEKYCELEKENKCLKIERSILGTQLIRRNDEIYLLYEKIRINENLIKTRETVIAELEGSFKILNLKVKSLSRESFILKQNQNVQKSFEADLALSRRDLYIERAKRNAFENLSVNIHHWRKLKYSDPDKHELLIKINLLQKRLIYKTEQVVDLEMKFQEKDRLFMELKSQFSRRLLYDDNDRNLLDNYKGCLLDSKKQIKSLIAENNMLQQDNDRKQKQIDDQKLNVKTFLKKNTYTTVESQLGRITQL